MPTLRKRGLIERIGSALPESNILMLMLIGLILVASFFAQGSHPSAIRGTENYTVLNLLSIDGLRWILHNVLNNFRSYPPLAVVVVGVLGFNFTEKVGLLGTLIKKIGHSTSEKLILPVIIFIGINSSIASDAGYIVLIPLAGALYAGIGRNPLVGITVAFASVSAGFGAAMIPGPGDGLLGAITESVYQSTFKKSFPLNIITMNYLFMFASTIFLTILFTVVTKLVEHRANTYAITLPQESNMIIGELTPEEHKGLNQAGKTFIFTLGVFIILYFIGFLRPYTLTSDKIINPLLDDIMILLIILFVFPAISYGKAVNKIKNSKDYISYTVNAMRDVAYIIVFAIFAGNFLSIFSHSGLDKFIANNGAILLMNSNIKNPIVLMISFILITAVINIFIGSASAKWSILASIFVPMLIMVSDNTVGPEVIQVAYRIGDSSTNIVSPLMTYTGVVLIAARHYNNKFELGDLISLMLPYSLATLIGWTLFFMLWMFLGIPFHV